MSDIDGLPLPAGSNTRLGTLIFRHQEEVEAVDICPRGLILASAGGEILTPSPYAVRLWNTETGMPIRSLVGHRQRVKVIAFAPHGNELVTAGGEEEARIWDVGSGKQKGAIPTGKHVLAMAFSRNGDLVAFGRQDGKVLLWDFPGKQLRAVLPGPKMGVYCLHFSPDGTQLACGSYDKGIEIWDIKSQRLSFCLAGHAAPVQAVSFSPDGRFLVSGGLDKQVRVWSVKERKTNLTFNHEASVLAVRWSPDGKHVLSAGGTMAKHGVLIRCWSLDRRKEDWRAVGHADAVNALVYSPDGKHIFSGSSDRTIGRWLAKAGLDAGPGLGHRGGVQALTASLSGNQMFSGGEDGTIRVWDAASGRQLRSWRTPGSVPVRLLCSPCGKLLASILKETGAKRRVCLWDLSSGKQVPLLGVITEGVQSVAFAPNSHTLLMGYRDGILLAWDLQAKRLLFRVRASGTKGMIDDLIVAPNRKEFVAITEKRVVSIHEAATGKTLRRVSLPAPEVAGLSFQSTEEIALVRNNRTIDYYGSRMQRRADLQSWKVGETTLVHQMAFSADGRTGAAPTQAGEIQLWECGSQQIFAHFPGLGDASLLVWLPGGRYLAVARELDGSVLILDVPRVASAERADQPQSVCALVTAWEELASQDAVVAQRAMWRLIAAKDQTPTLLAQVLRPPVALDRAAMLALVVNLDHPSYSVREQATEALVKLQDLALPLLKAGRGEPISAERRRRQAAILSRIHRQSPEQLRLLRAVMILERLRSPPANAVLLRLSRGASQAWVTQAAEAACFRTRP